MPLVPLAELFERARREGYGLGYFEAWDLYSLEAALEAAEAEESPVILGFGCMMADGTGWTRVASRRWGHWGAQWLSGRAFRWRCC